MFVSQPGAGSDKIFCSMRMCFFQQVGHPKIAFIFGGTDKQIKDTEKQAYEYDVLVLFHKKAWIFFSNFNGPRHNSVFKFVVDYFFLNIILSTY